MTYDQFWNDDCVLARDYRKAEKINQKRRNQELWLQGMYIYDALCCVSPLLQAFAPKGTHAQPYPKEPYALDDQDKKDAEERAAKKMRDKGMKMMEAFAAQFNKKFEGG